MKLTQEIFAAGNWNGFPFTVNDLRKMAASFNDLKDVLKVPLKLGHNDEQSVTDGQPALGWVTGMLVDGDQTPPKLVAEFEDVPDIVFEAFTKKLYRSVSIELDFDVKHKGTMYDFVITAVALLGADMPAVNVLNDLTAFMSADRQLAESGYAAGSHLSFSTIKGSIEESTMTPEEEVKLRAELAKAQAENVAITVKFSALETQAATDAKAANDKFAQIEADRKAAEITAARDKFAAMLEGAVTDKLITPAQREAFAKALRLDDDDSVLALSEDDVKGLYADATGDEFSRDKSKQTKSDLRADHSLSTMTYAHMEKSGSTDFSDSLSIVMQANPELAAEYVDSNGEVSQ